MSTGLREPSFLILTALVNQPLHGYALLEAVEEASGGRVRLAVGSLYATLDRMAAQGWVAVAEEEVVNGRLRRTYEITAAGKSVLTAEVERMNSLVVEASRRLGFAPRPRPAGGVA
ncbi:PadR family transcriptional regulator [Ornithinimicrobium sp. W1679]|uniref:PadR family transcriptional regulator n=2 Tax=Ornithinimicrobium sp. W1679 TaxID=3418770 RepID=UPI003CEDCECE